MGWFLFNVVAAGANAMFYITNGLMINLVVAILCAVVAILCALVEVTDG